MKDPNAQRLAAPSAGPAYGPKLSALLLCVGIVVSLFGLSLVLPMDLAGAEHVLVGFLFAVPGSPYFLLGVAARHLRSKRERKALIGAFVGVLPTLLVYAPLQVYPRSVDGSLAAGLFIYWLPLVLPVTAGVGVAAALLWPVSTPTSESPGGGRRPYRARPVDRHLVASRSSLCLAMLGIALGVLLSIAAWLFIISTSTRIFWGPRIFWIIGVGGPMFAVGMLAPIFRTRRAFYGLAGAFFGSLLAPLGLALLIIMYSSDYRWGGFTGIMVVFAPLFAAGAMALCSAAGRRWYRLQCGEPGRSLLASDYPVYSDEPPARFWRRGGTGP